MPLDIGTIGDDMVAAASAALGKDWNAARTYAVPEFKRLAAVLTGIAEQTATGELTLAEARALLQIHQNTTRNVILAVQGLGLLAVENAVNAALGVVRDAINTAAGGILVF